MPPGAGPYFIGRIRGGDVAAITQPEQPGDPAAWRTYIQVERADDTAERVRAAGGTIVAEPFDTGDAGRMAVFADREGAVFRVWEPKQHKGAGVVNEHGAVNFNTLHTRDVESAKAFYRDGVRLGHARARSRHGDVDAARLRRPPRSENARPARADGLRRRPAPLRGRGGVGRPLRGGRDAALERDLRGRRRRRDRTQDGGARRSGDGGAVRRSVGQDHRAHRPAGRDLHGQQVRPREQGPASHRRPARKPPSAVPARVGRRARCPTPRAKTVLE